MVQTRSSYAPPPDLPRPQLPTPGGLEEQALPSPDSSVADRFIAAHASRWCTPGQAGSGTCAALPTPRPIRRVIIHTLAVASTAERSGTEAVIAGWQRRRRQASSHYLVDRDGTITQMVREAHVAFHTPGNNRDSVGIEHADVCNDPAPLTTPLYERSAALVRDLSQRHGFIVSPATVAGHHDVMPNHGDPGPYWDWEYYRLLLGWDGVDPRTRPLRLVVAAVDAGPAPDGWSVGHRRRIRNSRCAGKRDPWGARYWRAQPAVSGTSADLRFVVDDPGTYSVALWWPRVDGANRSVGVEITVACVTSPCQQQPSSQAVTVNQRQNTGSWQPIGAVDISHAPAEVRVRVTRNSPQAGWIVCDAARLLRISAVATSSGETSAERVGPLEVRELMHPRIDVDAQRALRRMSQGDEAASTDANGMFEAVANGELAGIFAANQMVPALRAKRMGVGWWQLIPEGQDSAVVAEPGQPTNPPPAGDAAPLIAFRDALRKDPPRLDAALRRAWASFQLLRSGELHSCEPEGAILTATLAEADPTAALIPIANIVPVLCQLRRTPPKSPPSTAPPAKQPTSRPASATSLRSGTFIEILQGGESIRVPTLPHLGFFDINVGTIVVGGVNLVARLPGGGAWQIGVVQNVVVHQGSLLYRRGTVRWFSGAPLLDVLDGAADIWGPPPPTPVPIGGTDVTIPNPVTVTPNPRDGSAGPFNIALADSARISLRGSGDCGPLLRGSVVVMFEAGIAARQGRTLVWLATSKQPYGFVVGVDVNANGSADFTTTAIGKLGEIIASPPGNPLVTGPPTANQFTRTVVRRAFTRAFTACRTASTQRPN